jgi:hypothetical protein
MVKEIDGYGGGQSRLASNLVHHPASWMGSDPGAPASPVSLQSFSPSSKLDGVRREDGAGHEQNSKSQYSVEKNPAK